MPASSRPRGPAAPARRVRAAALLAAALAACGSPEKRQAKERLLAPGGSGGATSAVGAPPRPDPADPAAALRLDAGEAAARLGALEWSGAVAWTVARDPGPAPAGAAASPRVQVSERHRVRQLAGGDFEVQSDLDPGQGPGSETGKRVVHAGGTTYARSRYAASGAWRERPTDGGRGARRFRDESFGAAADVAALLGPALVLRPAGEATVRGRPARRFTFHLDREAFAPGASRLGPGQQEGRPDEDTARRLAFLDGRRPAAVDGEMAVDAATGVPLEVRLRAVFRVEGDPSARVDVDVSSRVTALGAAVPPVEPPSRALPDERKPRGVARALEAAGLRKRKAPAEAPPEPADDGE
jgi:hypothetical protein